jgi:ribosomal protein L16/L10AE
MPLMPKRVKYRKAQRGSRKGTASRNLRIDFGEFGLQTLDALGSPTRNWKPPASRSLAT